MQALVTWLSTRGGTCHVDTFLEAILGFTMTFGCPTIDVQDDELLSEIVAYVKARKERAIVSECSDIRDRIEQLLFKRHPNSYLPQRGADAREWTMLYFARVVGLESTLSINSGDGMCNEGCSPCANRDVSFLSDRKYKCLDLTKLNSPLNSTRTVRQCMLDLCSHTGPGVLRRQGCKLLYIGEDSDEGSSNASVHSRTTKSWWTQFHL